VEALLNYVGWILKNATLVPSQQRYQKFHSFLGNERIIRALEKFKPPKILTEKQLKIEGSEIELTCWEC
jgi:hypothetical protein